MLLSKRVTKFSDQIEKLKTFYVLLILIGFIFSTRNIKRNTFITRLYPLEYLYINISNQVFYFSFFNSINSH